MMLLDFDLFVIFIWGFGCSLFGALFGLFVLSLCFGLNCGF